MCHLRDLNMLFIPFFFMNQITLFSIHVNVLEPLIRLISVAKN